MRRLSREEIQKIIELRRRGLTIGRIAQRLGRSEVTVFYWLKRFGLTRPRKEGVKREILKLVREYGFITRRDLLESMVEKYGISEYTVYTYIRELCREGRVNSIRLLGAGMGRKPNRLNRVLRRTGLANTVFLYTSEGADKLARYLAKTFILALPSSPNFKYEVHGLKLCLRERLPLSFYELICRYL